MAEYEYKQLYYKQNEVLDHLQHWKIGASEFESILGSEKQFFKTKWNFRFRTVAWLTERKLAVLKI
jgi:hypothetical protein